MNKKLQERIGGLRLIKLAFHLKEIVNEPLGEFKVIAFYKWDGVHRVEIETLFPCQIIDELQQLFPEWTYTSTDSDIDTIPELFDFFCLSDEEFIHAFDLSGNQKIETYGGGILNRESNLKDIAENIFAIMQSRKK